MLFNSFQFLVFFPVVTTLYFLLPHRFRWGLLLAASCYFYMAFIPKYILILFVTITVDYFAGIGLERAQGNKKKWILFASILANIGMLGFFKYFNFANDNLAALANFIGWNYPIADLSIILPIGLSFHTFQSLSYTIEVYRGHQKAERHYGYLALYVLFYPQLVAGPIERPQNILHQLHEEHRFEYQRVTDGLKWMAWGMFKKVVIADRMALFVNPIYDSPTSHHGPALVFATLAFAIQIYCDFSGYSDIAFGAAQVMGVRLMKNFQHPYFAKSISEFWRRWHISLSTWFRDYVYIPLGGSRAGARRTAINLFITFVVSGLWHGANWTFVIWGALHGIFVLLNHILEPYWTRLRKTGFATRFPSALDGLSLLSTFGLVCFAWIFFRASTLPDAFYIATHLFSGWSDFVSQSINLLQEGARTGFWGFENAVFASIRSLSELTRSEIVLSMLALCFLLYVELKQHREDFIERFNQKRPILRFVAYSLLITTILALGTSYTGVPQAFIYFQF
ncbi:MAG: membrane-bound O-acyltransferase family protein [Anaerolineae bacterium]|nr:MAG: membrane-bound O-acyltransferase family protein [Anaerolineae bacterium]WKZ45467.1 MAG: MBOAT family O-acyltransferase [Anaerolineales bacterium]